MKMPTMTAMTMLMRISRFFHRLTAERPEQYERMYLCSMAPLSAGALRHNEEAERTHGHD